jgi:hypothetical protein
MTRPRKVRERNILTFDCESVLLIRHVTGIHQILSVKRLILTGAKPNRQRCEIQQQNIPSKRTVRQNLPSQMNVD